MNAERLCKLCARPVSAHGDDRDDCARHAILRIEALEQRAASLIKLIGEPACAADAERRSFGSRRSRAARLFRMTSAALRISPAALKQGNFGDRDQWSKHDESYSIRRSATL